MGALATETALLGATKWRRRVRSETAIEPDHAALDLFGYPQLKTVDCDSCEGSQERVERFPLAMKRGKVMQRTGNLHDL